jgi:hypothetical protein
MAKATKPPLVEVEWNDSHAEAGWRSVKDVLETAKKTHKVHCFTSGYLIASNAEFVLIASSYVPWTGNDTPEISETMQIPRSAVINIRSLTLGKILE